MTEQVVFEESFEISEETEEGITATGLALPFEEESRNRVIYNKSAATNNADTLQGKTVLFNHNEDRPIGHVSSVEAKEDGLYFEMNLDPQEENLLQKIKRGDVSNVSIQAMVDDENVDGNRVDIEDFLELSVVTVPGFPQTGLNMEDTMTASTFLEKYSGDEEKSEFIKKLEEINYFSEDNYKEDDYPWDQCIQDQKDQGYDDETAQKICAAIKNRAVKHLVDGGHVETPSEAIELIKTVVEKIKESRVAEPFADYDDFDDCVSQNQDKDTPEAFCAWLEHEITGKWPGEEEIENIENSNKSGAEESKDRDSMSDEETQDETDSRKEQDDLAERVDNMEDSLNEIKERLSAVEDQVGAESEEEESEEEKAESKQEVPEGKEETLSFDNALEEVKENE